MAVRNKTLNKSVKKTDNGPQGIHQFKMDKSYGQHILKNPSIVTNIIEKAQIKSTDICLEIGPGTGNLSVQILPLCKQLIVVEVDTRMVGELQKRIKNTPYFSKLKIIVGDVLKTELPYFDLCIANLPYQISSPITFKLLSHRPMFRCAVLMYQKEFAERLYAKAGENLYSRLSVNTQLLSKVEHCIKVGKNNFRPPPKVDSAVVKITPKNPPPPINFVEWDGLVRLAFSRKNKTIGAIFRQKTVISMLESNYKTYCSLNNIKFEDENAFREKYLKLIDTCEYSGSRAAKLDIDDFLKLLTFFNENGIHFS